MICYLYCALLTGDTEKKSLCWDNLLMISGSERHDSGGTTTLGALSVCSVHCSKILVTVVEERMISDEAG